MMDGGLSEVLCAGIYSVEFKSVHLNFIHSKLSVYLFIYLSIFFSLNKHHTMEREKKRHDELFNILFAYLSLSKEAEVKTGVDLIVKISTINIYCVTQMLKGKFTQK